METIVDVTKQMDIQTAVRSLDEMFYGWLGSARCGDELSSESERTEIGYYYRKIRELLTIYN